MHTRGIGLVCMILLARLPLLAQNLARICAGLLGQARCLQSPILSFPSRFPSSGDWCSSGWGPMTCQLSRAAWHRPIVPRYLRRCTLCSGHALGDERHFMLECPQFDDIRAQYADLLQDARDSMRNLMWHQNQKALSDFVIAILDEPRT